MVGTDPTERPRVPSPAPVLLLDDPHVIDPAETDESLMTAFAAGDEHAFRALYRRHANATLAFLVASTANREAAEDLLQETFSRVFRHRDDWSGGGRGAEGDSFRGWLFAIARNLARDAGRRATVRRRVAEELAPAHGARMGSRPLGAPEEPLLLRPSRELTPEEISEREDLARRITGALGKLPDAQREAFVMIRVQEMSYEEVAQACATTVAAAKMRVARATAALAMLLGDEFDAPPARKNEKSES